MTAIMKYFTRLTTVSLALFVFTSCQVEQPEPEPNPGPPTTDIWLYEFGDTGVNLLSRITNRDGYDNQPMFTSDNSKLLFSSDRTGRVNTHIYDIDTAAISQVTFSEADKYSPTPIPGTNDEQFSVVHSDSVIFQGLWRYAVDNSQEPAPITDVDAVAYFTWAGANNVLFWRLGEPNTLQLLDAATGDTTVLDVGRVESLHAIPGEAASSDIMSKEGENTEIKRFDWETQESTSIAVALEGARYFCWTPDGAILMVVDNELYTFKPGEQVDWNLAATLDVEGGSRLAVSPDGSMLAVVAHHTSGLATE